MCLGSFFLIGLLVQNQAVLPEKLWIFTAQPFLFIFFPPEFQNVLKTFSKMKDGRVAVDEVAAFLDNMAIPVNPETLKDIINHSYMDSELFEFC